MKNFMRDFDDSMMDIEDSFFQPAFNNDFFRPLPLTHDPQLEQLNKNFQDEYSQMIKKYQDQL